MSFLARFSLRNRSLVAMAQLTSYSNQGASIIVVEYNFGTDINQASLTLTQHINQAQTSLPSGITPQIQTFSVDALPVIQLAVTSSQDPIMLAAQVKQDVATVTQTYGPPQITHLGGVRTATVNATITSSNVGAVSQDVQQRINKLSLPSSATVSLGGVTSSQSQAFQGLILALIIAIVLVYLIMVVTFHSIILLVSIPFAATGSILLMLATNATLGVPALIGLLMLVGIVVTNAIVLLDLVPMAVGLSKAGGFIAGPLAIVVIGGLTTSTILTLLLVPRLYVIVEDIRGRLSRGHTTPPVPPANGESLESQDTQERTALA